MYGSARPAKRVPGWALEAQRQAIEDFAKREGFTINHWFKESESGAGSDALEKRPRLSEAITQARKARGPVVVAKLDRLSRDVHFISGLMAQRVEFICDGPRLTVRSFRIAPLRGAGREGAPQ